VPDVHDSATVH